MGLDREVEEVSRVERKIHKRTDVSSTRLRQKKIRMEVDMSDYVIGGFYL